MNLNLLFVNENKVFDKKCQNYVIFALFKRKWIKIYIGDLYFLRCFFHLHIVTNNLGKLCGFVSTLWSKKHCFFKNYIVFRI